SLGRWLSALAFVKLVAELSEAHLQELGGPGLNAATSLQRGLQELLFEAVERRLEVEALGRNLQRDVPRAHRPAELGGQRVDLEERAAAEHDGPFDRVLQLADVAGPAVTLE